MTELLKRSISGLVFVALPVFSLYAGAVWFLAFLAVCSFIAAVEYVRLHRLKNKKTGNFLISATPVFWTAVILAQLNLVPIHVLTGALLALVFIVLTLTLLSKNGSPADDVQTIFFGIVYTQLTFYSFYLFGNRAGFFNADIILFVLLLIWINDTFAYLSGKSFGKNKLHESLSPGKTWEGTGGGAVFALGSAFLLSKFVFGFEGSIWIFVGIIASIFATVGDLFESALKRRAGVKDAGNLIPGHGGVLDRFDAALFAVPACWAFIELFEGLI